MKKEDSYKTDIYEFIKINYKINNMSQRKFLEDDENINGDG